MRIQSNQVNRFQKLAGITAGQQHGVLQELLDSEVSKLKEFGYEIVDRYDVEPYTMLLLSMESEEGEKEYEVALTTGDQEFTTFASQATKAPQHSSNFLKVARKLIGKVKEWLSMYGDLMVGSLNKDRTYKYHRMFKGLGMNVGDVENTPADENFPESYNFTIHAGGREEENM